MSVSWIISNFPAPDLHGQTVEFRVPGKHGILHGIGTFEARALSGRRVVLRIRLQMQPGWARKEDILLLIPHDGCRDIEIHPNQSVARYRLFT